MESLNLVEVPLQESTLIEASAGTGKTYTISALYLRLVVELGLPVERILVVTYTRAATAELRGRIRELLSQALRGLRDGGDGDPLIQELAARWEEREQAMSRLRLAILDFDRAVILTIHGFCQRVLADSAIESAVAVEQELIPDQWELQQQVVDDFWQRRIADLPPGLVRYLLDQKMDPDGMARMTAPAAGRPYLELRGSPWPGELQRLEREFLAGAVACRRLWRDEGETLRRLLLESGALNRNKYRVRSLQDWLDALALWLASDPPPPLFDKAEKFGAATLAKSVKKGHEAPSHPFFDQWQRLLEGAERLDQAYEQAQSALLVELAEHLRRELPRRKRRLRLQAYDDLLLDLQQALSREETDLAARLRGRYAAALIDEFQDTDPIQYDIFRRIYSGSDTPLFLVGDPKQAIYGFRGADLFTYLRAREDVGRRLTLDVNWRSVPELLTCVNLLFAQNLMPFLEPRIQATPVRPAPRELPRLEDPADDAGPFRVRLLAAGEKPLSKESAGSQSVADTAAEIARLLGRRGGGRCRLGGRELGGGEIAVLVRTHAQGAMVAEALRAWGIASVLRSRDDVFHSDEAEQLQRLLAAVLEPAREGVLRAALATDAIGLGADRLDRDRATGQAELDRARAAFREYHRLWREQGFMPMFRHLLAEQGVAERLLGLDRGERRLTNLLHLAELLHARWREQHAGMESLVKWLRHQRLSQLPEDEVHQLRLESERDLVQIVTIHRSKGLQYPVVFVPFAWDGGMGDPKKWKTYQFHDPARDWAPVLELGSADRERDLPLARREALAEAVRLLYVALTRAEQRCYLYWGRVNKIGESPLGWLLHGAGAVETEQPLEALEREMKGLGAAELARRLARLEQAAGGALRVEPVAETQTEPEGAMAVPAAAPGEDGLRARTPRRRLTQWHRVTSFSALAHGGGDVDLPDHDAVPGPVAAVPERPPRRDIFGFPRGARAGTALHALFERIDDFRHVTRSRLRTLVPPVLREHGIDVEWSDVVCAMVEEVLASPLDPSGRVRLERVASDARLVEMGFHYPLRPLDADALATVLLAHGFGGDGPLRQAVERLDLPRVQGFLKGFVDLVFRLDGRYYLVDYKSNWLGEETAAYGQARLAAVMAAEDYWLQYLFYTIALHRYLGRRLPDYDYDRHMGGVYYLFLRGMDRASSPVTGVFHDRPAQALVEALDRLLGPAGEVI